MTPCNLYVALSILIRSLIFSPLQQALSDQELSALQILAMRRRMKLGDLESDDEPPVRREPPAAAPAPGLDTGLFMGRIERVEHQVHFVDFFLLHHSTDSC